MGALLWGGPSFCSQNTGISNETYDEYDKSVLLCHSLMLDVLVVPEAITFEQAIALTQALLERVALDQITTAEITTIVSDLVQTKSGARGFFVTYLTDSRPQTAAMTSAVMAGLQAAPAIVAELLIKNLAMATAMSLVHQRQQHPELAQSSLQVQSRTQALIQGLNGPELVEQGRQLWQSLIDSSGSYGAFLQRGNYDAEQKQAIQQVLAQVLPAASGG